ncbi:MAG: muconolactone Delta-isomerase family protein [Planctomycetota bacterium]|mgnify:CR=1 FL=1
MAQYYLAKKEVSAPTTAHATDNPQLLALSMKSFEYCQKLKEMGYVVDAWCIVGKPAGVWIIKVEDLAELDDILMNLPMFPFVQWHVEALTDYGARYNGLRAMIQDKLSNRGTIQQLCNEFWKSQGQEVSATPGMKDVDMEPPAELKEGPGVTALRAIEGR